jgi:hypothetical protein
MRNGWFSDWMLRATGEATMTKSPKTALHRRPAASSTALGPPLDAFFTFNQNALERWVQAMIEISQEIAQFTQARLEEDVAAWVRFAGCRSPDEALECQQHFLERASGQYLMESNRLSQMIAGLTSAGASPARHAGTPS